jgi:hypothetical protein
MRPWIKELWERYESQEREVNEIIDSIRFRYKDILDDDDNPDGSFHVWLEQKIREKPNENSAKRWEQYHKEHAYWKMRQHNHEDFYFWIVDKMTDYELSGESEAWT